jgi:hypothetical protein
MSKRATAAVTRSEWAAIRLTFLCKKCSESRQVAHMVLNHVSRGELSKGRKAGVGT